MTDRDRTAIRTETTRPLLEQFQLVGDGVDWLLSRLAPIPLPAPLTS